MIPDTDRGSIPPEDFDLPTQSDENKAARKRVKRFVQTVITVLLVALLLLPAFLSISQGNPLPIVFDETDPITLPVALYILVDDADQPDPALSSQRTSDNIQTILAGTNEIWAVANIRFEAVALDYLVVPEDVLVALVGGDFHLFFQQVMPPRTKALITGYYAPQIGGPNGIAFTGARVFFVRDAPTVYDRRVTSHEIGHILGLYHTQNDLASLMAPGTNGVLLTKQEATVARYFAAGLLNGLTP